MVGSKHGWYEVPYVLAPSNVQDIAQHVVRLADVEQARIHIVPGVQCRSLDGIPDGIPDVMRGEETQILGALTMLPECAVQSCMILPGTHSKWVHVQDAMIQKFATHMTGELFALLRQHSVLGRLMCSTEQLDSSAFTRGVRDAKTGKENGLTHQLFAVRTLGLMDDLPPEHLSDYMSGLLIGYEIQAGLSWRIQAKLQHAPIVIIGDAILCARYALALSYYGFENVSVLENTAAQGLWRIEQAIIEPSHSQSEKIKNEKYLF
jgi:2-dehydro-3-deoxygalactonokinase